MVRFIEVNIFGVRGSLHTKLNETLNFG